MLNHREKRRYLAVMYEVDIFFQPNQIHEKIVSRFKELFGSLHAELAFLKLYDSELDSILFIGCKLKYLDNLLVSLSMTQPSLTVVSLSGTLKKLRKNVARLNIGNIKNNAN